MALAALTEQEIQSCRHAFTDFDEDCSGAISAHELKATLNSMGQHPTEDEIFDMIAEVDTDGSGEIEFVEFLMVIQRNKAKSAKRGDDSDTIDAFIALGGKEDTTGNISTEKLRSVVREFGLTIDIERLIAEADSDKSGFVDFKEFKAMMSE